MVSKGSDHQEATINGDADNLHESLQTSLSLSTSRNHIENLSTTPISVELYTPQQTTTKPITASTNGFTNTDKKEEIAQKTEEEQIKELPLYKAKDHDKEFDPVEYLQGFYCSPKEDGAMQTVLFFLPGILYRLPDKVGTLLDVGAGPTVYIPIAVRLRAKNVFTSDYSEQNREKLVEWIKDESKFDWSNICQWIANIESSSETSTEMQAQARKNMRAVLKVNVHEDEVIQGIHYLTDPANTIPKQFDVVTTIFCLEYAGESLEEYKKAVRGVTRLIKPGGCLIQGGVFEAKEYCFGGKRFKCHYLTREQLIETLKENSMCAEDNHKDFRLIVNVEVFLLFSKKAM